LLPSRPSSHCPPTYLKPLPQSAATPPPRRYLAGAAPRRHLTSAALGRRSIAAEQPSALDNRSRPELRSGV